MKKRKLNSKNPKYIDKSQLTEREVARQELICEVPTRTIKGKLTNRKAKVSSIWFTN
jgi:hypothetical protein